MRNLILVAALAALLSGCKSDYTSVNRQSRDFLRESWSESAKTRKASLKAFFDGDRISENKKIRYEGRGFLYESFSTPGWTQGWKDAGGFVRENIETDRAIRRTDTFWFGFKDTD
ncbi:MAG: hypothetical protein V3T86_00205 [Planctomycetota bacterium]